MIGRQVIITNRAFTLEELNQFMEDNWDGAQYGGFAIGRPTPASIEEYIMLSATQRYMVIVYPRRAGGLFFRKNKVILTVCHTPSGAARFLSTSVNKGNISEGIWKISQNMSMENERKGPAEEALQKYAGYMRTLLETAGYTR